MPAVAPPIVQICTPNTQSAGGSVNLNVQFSAPTVAEDCLLCVVVATETASSPGTPTIALPITPGVTWEPIGSVTSPAYPNFSDQSINVVKLFLAINVPPLSDTTQTTCQVTLGTPGDGLQCGLQVMELEGVVAVDQVISNYGLSTPPATAGTLAATTADTIVVYMVDPKTSPRKERATPRSTVRREGRIALSGAASISTPKLAETIRPRLPTRSQAAMRQ